MQMYLLYEDLLREGNQLIKLCRNRAETFNYIRRKKVWNVFLIIC
jgi:hypothetical protein